MTKKQSELPKNREKAKQYQKYLTITLSDGTTKDLKFRGSSEEEAIAKRERARIEYEMGLLVVNEKSPFWRYADAWLEIYKAGHSEGATVDVERRIKKHLMPVLGALDMKQIRLMHLEKCLLEMKGKSMSNYKKTYWVIRKLFAHAHNNEIIPRNPAAALELPQGESGTRRELTDLEKEAFFKVVPRHQFGLFFAIMYGCGLRPGEVRALTIFNVDADKKLLSVANSVKMHTQEIGTTKTKSSVRTVIIPDWLWNMLAPVVEERKHGSCSYIFHGADNKHINKQRLGRAWESFLRLMDIEAGAELYRNKVVAHSDIGWEELTPYYIRHTYCTCLEEMGLSDKMKKHLMGHSTSDVTNAVYTHVTPAMMESARLVINEYYANNYPGKANDDADNQQATASS